MKKIKNVITMENLKTSMLMDYLVFNEDLKALQNTFSYSVEGMYFNYKSEKVHLMYCIKEISYFIFEDTKKQVTYVLNFDKNDKLTFRKSSSLEFTKKDLMFICSCWEFIRSQTRVNNYKKLDKRIHSNVDYKYYKSKFTNYKKSTYRIYSNSH